MANYGLSELFIALIEAFGGPRPTSNGPGELYEALIQAVGTFGPTTGWPANNASGPGNLQAETPNTDTVGYQFQDQGSGGVRLQTSGSGQLRLVDTGSTGLLLHEAGSGPLAITASAGSSGVVITDASGTGISLNAGAGGQVTAPTFTPNDNAITAASNAATIPTSTKVNTVTNNSAAGLTITMSTTGSKSRQPTIVCILDASAVAQTLTWVNTENSHNVSVPANTAGSTTIPLIVGFMFNAGTTKHTCVAVA